MRPKPYERQVLDEPGRREWKQQHRGCCSACGYGPDDLERHHIVTEQRLRQEGYSGTVIWDLRNALEVGRWCRCHARHTTGAHRFARSIIPPAAVEFAVEVLGDGPAELFFQRYYADR
jgi:hypothetical protein